MSNHLFPLANSVSIGKTDSVDINGFSLRRKQINASLHIITVGTKTALNKYSVAVPYEDGAYKTPLRTGPIYTSIRTYGWWVRGLRRAGVYAGRNE